MRSVIVIKAAAGEEERALKTMKRIWEKINCQGLRFTPEEFNFLCPLANEIQRLELEAERESK